MAKQFVTEVHTNNVQILINGVCAKEYWKNHKKYDDYNDPSLDGKREYEEIRDGNTVKYWIHVADTVQGVDAKVNVQSNYKYWAKQKAKYALILKKKERIEKYRKMIESSQEIWGTPEDINDGLALMNMEKRQPLKFPVPLKDVA